MRVVVLPTAVDVSRRPDHTVTAILGGLTASSYENNQLQYARLPIEAGQVVIIVPDLPQYAAQARAVLPPTVTLSDALRNIASVPLLIDALRRGDHKLLRGALTDHLIAPTRLASIPGISEVIDVALHNNATGVVLCGTGPSLIAFAPRDHKPIADAMIAVFADHSIPSRAWVIPLDTQGIVLSAAQST